MSVFLLMLDPAVDDFVLMHCVFMPNSQLCPLLMAQYPFCLSLSCFVYLGIKYFLFCLYTVCYNPVLHLSCISKFITLARIICKQPQPEMD